MKHDGGSAIFKNAARAALILICAMIFARSMPVNYFTVSGRGKQLFSAPAPNGYPFVTTYIHSLELTPVRDDYRFVGGKIWGWEEWTVSLNAGLPSVPSPFTRFAREGGWMITRGGRRASGVIYYRIGTDEFGRNVWEMPPWKPVNIFEKYPRYRVSLEASVVPFREAKLTGFDTIHSQPDANRRIFSL